MIAGIAGVSAAACSAPVIAPAPPSGELIAFGGGPGGPRDACFTCHGIRGEGDGDAARLAGLSGGYLLKQLEDYARRRRDHPEMSKIAMRLSDADKLAVSSYYAMHAVSLAGGPRPAEPPAVSRLYTDGDSVRDLKPCADCHGPAGEGQGLARPALQGQPTIYTATQLRDWKSGKRRNDPENVMGFIARKLTNAEIDALAAYLEALE